jgi:hypothetical protein
MFSGLDLLVSAIDGARNGAFADTLFSEESTAEPVPEKFKINRVKKPRKPDNPYGRFYSGNSKVSCVLGTEAADGTISFSQDNLDDPYYRPIEKVVPSEDVSLTPRSKRVRPYLEAYTPYGTKMESHRKMNIEEVGESGERIAQTLFFLSPSRGSNKYRIGDAEPLSPSSFNSLLDEKNEALGSLDSLDSPYSNVCEQKGGFELTVPEGKRDRRKMLSQKAVMGITAKENLVLAIADAERKNLFSPDILKVMQQIAAEKSAEFLHCYAVSLCPEAINPQERENLGVGASCVNTAMMVLEIVAKRMAKMENVTSKVISEFFMLPDTDVIKEIRQRMTFSKQDPVTGVSKTLIFSRALKALTSEEEQRGIWPSAADMAQTERVALRMLNRGLFSPISVSS